jgi:Fic family protein
MGFNPTFVKVATTSECADSINLPHEDYPNRVGVTEEMISTFISSEIQSFSEFDCKSIHGHIMHDLPQDKGCWRSINVTVGEHSPCPPYMIAGEMEEHGVFPMNFYKMDESDIIRWYRQFQIIHPFIDGNGRVGGVIVAVASHYLSKGEWMLAPCQ